MSKISRRKFLTAGLTATAGVSGLGVAANLAMRYGIVPPDSGGIYGPGETLTYAAHRLLARHSLAREFPRSMISKVPFANSIPPLNDTFKRLQEADFVDWRLAVDGMVARPGSYSLADLRSFPVRGQITEVVCEEGWSYIAEWIGTPLFEVLKDSGVLPQARYLVYFSIDPDWWEPDFGVHLPGTFVAHQLERCISIAKETPLQHGNMEPRGTSIFCNWRCQCR